MVHFRFLAAVAPITQAELVSAPLLPRCKRRPLTNKHKQTMSSWSMQYVAIVSLSENRAGCVLLSTQMDEWQISTILPAASSTYSSCMRVALPRIPYPSNFTRPRSVIEPTVIARAKTSKCAIRNVLLSNAEDSKLLILLWFYYELCKCYVTCGRAVDMRRDCLSSLGLWYFCNSEDSLSVCTGMVFSGERGSASS